MIEETIGEPPAVVDCALAEPSLAAQIVLVGAAQGVAGDLLRRQRRRGRHADFNEMLGEATRDIGVFVRFSSLPLFALHEIGRQFDSEILGLDTAFRHDPAEGRSAHGRS